MAHFVYLQSPAGTWVSLDVISPAQMSLLDQQLFKAINGDDGGTWNPSAPIIFGGQGIQAGVAGGIKPGVTNGITGDVSGGIRATVSGGIISTFLNGIYSTVQGGITPGVAWGILANLAAGIASSVAGGIVPLVAGGIRGNVAGGIQANVAGSIAASTAGGIVGGVDGGIKPGIAGGITSDILGGIKTTTAGGFQLAGGDNDYPIFSSSRGIIRRPTMRPLLLGSGWTQTEDMFVGPATTANSFFELGDLIHGATLDEVYIHWAVANSHANVPASRPRFSVWRRKFDQVLKEYLNSGSYLELGSDASGAAYYAAGAIQLGEYACNQNNVIDKTQYMYGVTVRDESGANSSSGNVYVSVGFTQYIDDMRPA